jgi:hypothetical protein
MKPITDAPHDASVLFSGANGADIELPYMRW